MKYTLQYKRPGQKKWKKLENVVGECSTFSNGQNMGYWHVAFTGNRSETFPIDTRFRFPAKRNKALQRRIDQQAGQSTKKGQ